LTDHAATQRGLAAQLRSVRATRPARSGSRPSGYAHADELAARWSSAGARSAAPTSTAGWRRGQGARERRD
jgi:hypothetical protein